MNSLSNAPFTELTTGQNGVTNGGLGQGGPSRPVADSVLSEWGEGCGLGVGEMHSGGEQFDVSYCQCEANVVLLAGGPMTQFVFLEEFYHQFGKFRVRAR